MRALRIMAAALAVVVSGPAPAQDYPNKPVRIIVPFGPGTGIDLAARHLADRLRRNLGQSFVVENRAGAGATIGSAAVAAAAPDGYTLLMHGATHTTVAALMKNLPYNAQRDFVGVAIVGETPLVLVTSKSSGYASLKDLVAAAKAKPGALNFGSAGVGTITHLAAEKFRLAVGFQAQHVPFKSTTDAMSEVIAGRVDYLVTSLSTALGPIKEGRLVALAMASRRSAALPGVPTLEEAGVPGASTDAWVGLLAPARTPRDIVVRLHQETVKALSSPEARDQLEQSGVAANFPSLEEFESQLKRDFVDNAHVINSLGIKLE